VSSLFKYPYYLLLKQQAAKNICSDGWDPEQLTLRAVRVLIVLAPQFWIKVRGMTSRALATAL